MNNLEKNSQSCQADVSGSVTITEDNVLELGFIKHSEYTYKIFKNNVTGYLDEIEVFFEPNEEISIILRQQTFNINDLDRNSIFIRDMKYNELKSLVSVLCGSV